MRELDLDSAISEIIQACPDSNDANPPFFFIVGAGVSRPIIETASGLMDECKAIALQNGKTAKPSSQDRMDTYSHWMDAAFPQAEHRREYLQKKIQGKNISPATLRLAHLIDHGRIARTVVTPNFDDFLTRALTLFGVSHIVCDHPHTVRRLATQSENRQILHVHGTYWFYDCCNLNGEIEQRTRDGAAAVFSFLTNLLWQSSPIVIGYSGWKSDVIMTALKARLTDQVLPYNIYWFCHDHNELVDLPDWLKEHQSVRFIVPKISSNSNDPKSPMSLDGSSEPPMSSGDSSGSNLEAVTVLSRFVQRLELKEPPLFNDPLRFFAGQIQRDIYPDDNHHDDIYNLKNLAAKIASATECNRAQNNNVETNATLVEKTLNAVRSANSNEVLNLCKQIAPAALNTTQRDDLVNSLAGLLKYLRDQNADLALQVCEWALTFSGDINDVDISEACEAATVHASYIKGELLMEMERNEEAVTAFELCIKSGRKFEHDMPDCSKVAEALFSKGFALETLERPSDAIDAYNEFWEFYIDPARQSRHIRQLLARSRTNQGMAYQNSDQRNETQYDKALTCFRDVVAKFGNETNEMFYEPVAKSLVHMGMVLRHQGHLKKAIQAYDKVLDRFRGMPSPALQDPLVKALANKGMALEDLGQTDDALNCYDEMVRRIGPAPDTFFYPVLAGILNRQGRLLLAQGNHEQALTCFEKALAYSDESDPDRARILASRNAALANLGRSND
jgi:tetratricopeptide (TPR) repeat protein